MWFCGFNVITTQGNFMKISYIRHGESEANILKVLSSKIEEPYKLTENGINQIKTATLSIKDKIMSVYSSPFPRTIQSAEVIIDSLPDKPNLIIDDRIAEINYGNYNGKPTDEKLDGIRKKQIAGDYEIRFGSYGENKREILMRICDFLIDMINNHDESDHIIAVSHSVIISLAESLISQINNLQKEHIHTHNASVKTFTLTKKNRDSIQQIIDELKDRKKQEEQKRKKMVKNKFRYFPRISKKLQNQSLHNYVDIAKNGVDNPELSNDILDLLTDGFYHADIKLITKRIDTTKLEKNDVILICAFKNAHNLIKLFIEHYRKIGINKFVFIDNGSTDESVEIITNCSNDINVDVWYTDDEFEGYKSCGWRQRMMTYYGVNRWYLDLDVDELFVYNGIESGGISKIINYATKNNLKAIGSVMLDTYSNKPVLNINKLDSADIQKVYKYIDRDTYTKIDNAIFKYRIFGGPRNRVFHIKPFLQKLPLIYVEDSTMNINPHFWYPFSVNFNSQIVSVLLHYKFLPGDFDQYKEYVKSGVHWNNSSEYKVYVSELLNNKDLTFFDINHSMEYKSSKSLGFIKIIDDIPLNS